MDDDDDRSFIRRGITNRARVWIQQVSRVFLYTVGVECILLFYSGIRRNVYPSSNCHCIIVYYIKRV